MSRLAAPYVPRRPLETVLYAMVKDHRDDFMQYARNPYDGPLPRYVVHEFRSYLECGDFATAHSKALARRSRRVQPDFQLKTR